MNNSTTLRNLMLDLCDVSETSNACTYFSKLTQARIDNQITWKQYFLLNGDFYLHCQRNKIESPKSLPLFIKTIG
jgi:hypothetical protein